MARPLLGTLLWIHAVLCVLEAAQGGGGHAVVSGLHVLEVPSGGELVSEVEINRDCVGECCEAADWGLASEVAVEAELALLVECEEQFAWSPCHCHDVELSCWRRAELPATP